MKQTVQKSPWYESWKILKKNKTALVCGCFVLFTLFTAVFSNQISPHPFDEQNTDLIFASPSWDHLLGTDNLGRDLLSRLIHGTKVSLAVGVLSTLVALIFGVFYGSLSGWIGGRTDALMMRFLDLMYAIPTLVLLILVKIIFESIVQVENPELRAVISIVAALSINGWLNLGRVVRGQVLQIKNCLYVEAARALGSRHLRIIIKQILPNMMGPIIVMLTIYIPSSILAESFLSFLGLGLQPPYSSWGILASEGWKVIRIYPHLMIAPGVALFLTCLAFNLLGDGLQDALDPQNTLPRK